MDANLLTRGALTCLLVTGPARLEMEKAADEHRGLPAGGYDDSADPRIAGLLRGAPAVFVQHDLPAARANRPASGDGAVADHDHQADSGRGQ